MQRVHIFMTNNQKHENTAWLVKKQHTPAAPLLRKGTRRPPAAHRRALDRRANKGTGPYGGPHLGPTIGLSRSLQHVEGANARGEASEQGLLENVELRVLRVD